MACRINAAPFQVIAMPVEISNPLIEEALSPWRDTIGSVYEGYRGHVYRVFNFCLALHPATDEDRAKLAIAVVFHDIGLWSDRTLDYLSPSVMQAQLYLERVGRGAWAEEIGLMIDRHHQITPYNSEARYPLVEVFRKADLADFSLGVLTGTISASNVKAIKREFPNAGFHLFLVITGVRWFLKHPLRPLPFLKW